MQFFKIKIDIAQAEDCEFLDEITLLAQATSMDDARMLVMNTLQKAFPINSIDCENMMPDVNEEDLPDWGEGRGGEPTKPAPIDWEQQLSHMQLKPKTE